MAGEAADEFVRRVVASLRQVREDQGLTVNKHYIENEERSPTLRVLAGIANALDVRLSDMVIQAEEEEEE